MLVKWERTRKTKSRYDPTPYRVTAINGTMVSAERPNHKITHNVSFFKLWIKGNGVSSKPTIPNDRPSRPRLELLDMAVAAPRPIQQPAGRVVQEPRQDVNVRPQIDIEPVEVAQLIGESNKDDHRAVIQINEPQSQLGQQEAVDEDAHVRRRGRSRHQVDHFVAGPASGRRIDLLATPNI